MEVGQHVYTYNNIVISRISILAGPGFRPVGEHLYTYKNIIISTTFLRTRKLVAQRGRHHIARLLAGREGQECQVLQPLWLHDQPRALPHEPASLDLM